MNPDQMYRKSILIVVETTYENALKNEYNVLQENISRIVLRVIDLLWINCPPKKWDKFKEYWEYNDPRFHLVPNT